MMKSPSLRFKADDGTGYPDWKQTSLDSLCSIVGGGTPSTSTQEFWGGNIQWFVPSEIGKEKYVSKSQRAITELGLKESSARMLPKGTVLLSTRATLGEMSIAEVECTTNQGFQSLIPNEKTTSEFLYYQQPQITYWCHRNASGSTFLEISKQNLAKCPINFPSLSEQTKIADFLSSIDEKITLTNKKITKLKQFKLAALQKIFSQKIRFKADDGSEYPEWEEKRLEDITSHFQSGKGITTASISENGEYPVYGGNGLRGYTDSYTHDGRYVLIGRQGALCGNVNIIDGKNFISEHAVAVKAMATSDIGFLYYLFTKMNLNRYSESSAQPGLSVQKLLKLKQFVPSFSEQKKIADFLSALDQNIELHQQKLDKLKHLKMSLLQKMFA